MKNDSAKPRDVVHTSNQSDGSSLLEEKGDEQSSTSTSAVTAGETFAHQLDKKLASNASSTVSSRNVSSARMPKAAAANDKEDNTDSNEDDSDDEADLASTTATPRRIGTSKSRSTLTEIIVLTTVKAHPPKKNLGLSDSVEVLVVQNAQKATTKSASTVKATTVESSEDDELADTEVVSTSAWTTIVSNEASTVALADLTAAPDVVTETSAMATMSDAEITPAALKVEVTATTAKKVALKKHIGVGAEVHALMVKAISPNMTTKFHQKSVATTAVTTLSEVADQEENSQVTAPTAKTIQETSVAMLVTEATTDGTPVTAETATEALPTAATTVKHGQMGRKRAHAKTVIEALSTTKEKTAAKVITSTSASTSSTTMSSSTNDSSDGVDEVDEAETATSTVARPSPKFKTLAKGVVAVKNVWYSIQSDSKILPYWKSCLSNLSTNAEWMYCWCCYDLAGEIRNTRRWSIFLFSSLYFMSIQAHPYVFIEFIQALLSRK